MPKRRSYDIKQTILLVVSEKPVHLTSLGRKVNTGYRTIKENCQELEELGLLDIQQQKSPTNGRLSYVASISENGLKIMKKRNYS